MKKTLKKALGWIDDHEEGIWALIFMGLFLMNTYCAIRTYINPEWDTESVTHYAVLAVLDLLISILYLRIELDKAEIGLLRKIMEKQRGIINELLNNKPWKK
ncbi:MAG: hypothetical protein ACI4TD_14675 [Phocaeicola sp.]